MKWKTGMATWEGWSHSGLGHPSLEGREGQGLQSPAGGPGQWRERKRTAGPPKEKKANLLDVGSSRLLQKSVQAYEYFLKWQLSPTFFFQRTPKVFYDSSLQNSKAFSGPLVRRGPLLTSAPPSHTLMLMLVFLPHQGTAASTWQG